ncbi:helix-turn-helix domain-containing protein [Epilithonimonas vandammei]|jgi:excisionase family DNA binding protein|uniref:helix-turn-helix domain-containing protein n=1 Tax=Epilithonimonas vandammei TaxID=2487072 RepID=UPI0028A2C6DD|nr:helix-turn-helix domain-containing protein [Epilithonimonas vandammei]
MEKSLEERISEIEKNLFVQKNVLSFEEASKFLNLSKSYLYKLTSGGQIPHYKPQGKILYFDKEELENWLRQNPVRSKKEIEDMATSFIAFSNKRNRK